MTKKIKYFVGNWKMFGDFNSFKIIYKINKFCANSKKTLNKKKVVLCVPNTLLYYFKNKLRKKIISLGAQNCHHNSNYGAFTGSINASMLKKTGAEYIILGHSENRADGDTEKIIKKKIESSLKQNLSIIFCIGETLKQKNKGLTFSTLKKQIKGSIIKKFDLKKIIIAYEPVWSIGTNKILKMNELRKIISFINKEYKKIFKTKRSPTVLYGGSVNDKNISFFSSISEIDGFLVGGASQSSKKFIDIIKNYYK